MTALEKVVNPLFPTGVCRREGDGVGVRSARVRNPIYTAVVVLGHGEHTVFISSKGVISRTVSSKTLKRFFISV